MPLVENEVKVYDCSVRVCKPCVKLEGQECHTPDCVFFLRSMAEVKHYLDVMLLCPVIRNQDGVETERIVLVPSEASTPTDEVNRRARAEALEEAAKVVDVAGTKWADQARDRKSKTYAAYVIAALDLQGQIRALITADVEQGESQNSVR